MTGIENLLGDAAIMLGALNAQMYIMKPLGYYWLKGVMKERLKETEGYAEHKAEVDKKLKILRNSAFLPFPLDILICNYRLKRR